MIMARYPSVGRPLQLDRSLQRMLRHSVEQLALSARDHDKILRVGNLHLANQFKYLNCLAASGTNG